MAEEDAQPEQASHLGVRPQRRVYFRVPDGYDDMTERERDDFAGRMHAAIRDQLLPADSNRSDEPAVVIDDPGGRREAHGLDDVNGGRTAPTSD